MPLPTAGHEPAATAQEKTPKDVAELLPSLLVGLDEGGADSVKVEGDKERPKTNKDNIKTIIDGGIAVTGHIGLRSQHTSVLEGLRAQGCTSIQARRFIEDALAVQKADLVLHVYMDSNYCVDAQTKAQMKPQQTSTNAATESANDYCGTPAPAPTKTIVYIALTSSDNHRLGAQTLFVTSVLSPFEAAWMLSQP
uniref:3-methyl-2-oxobutanoate hydroxymethyltransferase n=1 Tax=Phytophthora ramorum TaxID=164328 RepID=H3H2Q7_PHYRM